MVSMPASSTLHRLISDQLTELGERDAAHLAHVLSVLVQLAREAVGFPVAEQVGEILLAVVDFALHSKAGRSYGCTHGQYAMNECAWVGACNTEGVPTQRTL